MQRHRDPSERRADGVSRARSARQSASRRADRPQGTSAPPPLPSPRATDCRYASLSELQQRAELQRLVAAGADADGATGAPDSSSIVFT